MERFSLKTLLIIVVVLLIGIVGLFRIQQRGKSVMAGWYNDSWQYRKAITIGYTGASALTDFQVSVNIGTSALIAAGKMKSDCNDIRFTDQTGKLLDYWIEENNPGCNQTTDTKIWIKMPRVNTTGTNIYLYYGNPSATTVQDGNKVFEFFDDFNENNIKVGWTGNGTEWQIDTLNGQKTISIEPSTSSRYLIFNNYIQPSSVIIESNVYSIMASDNQCHPGILFYGNTTNFYNDHFYFRPHNYNNTSNIQSAYYNGALQMLTTYTGNYNWNVWNKIKILVNGDNADVYIGDVYKGTKNGLQYDGSGNKIGLASHSFGKSYWNYIFVRKYAPSDPTKTLLDEERSLAPIAHWSFDEGVGTTVYDSSSNQNHGVINGATWQTEDQCISGKCLSFNGSTNYIDTTSIINTTDITFSVWVKVSSAFPSTSRVGNIIGNFNYDNPINFEIHTDGKLRGYWNGYNIYSTTDLRDSKWHNVVFTRNKTTNKITLYIDGKFEIDGVSGSDLNLTGPFRIGGDYRNGLPPNNPGIPFNGFIDEVKIYPYARTAAQIKQDYRAGLAGQKAAKGVNVAAGSKSAKSLSDGLVGYWKMDEGVGTTTADSSGNSNTGTNNNNSWISGKYGIGISLSGANSRISLGNSSSLNTGDYFTISGWYKFSSINASDNYFYNRNSQQTGSGFHIIYISGASSAIKYQYTNGSSLATKSSSTLSWNTGQWYNISVVHDNINKKIYFYRDGTNVGTVTYTDNALNVTSGTAYLGGYQGDNRFNGIVDELRIYNRALNPSEVTALYEYAPGPVAYYDFEEGVGTTAFDKSGNGLNGVFGIGDSSPNWNIGKFGKGLNITTNGQFAKVVLGSSASKFYTNSTGKTFTYSMWFKSSNINTGNQYLLTDNSPCNNEGNFAISLQSGIPHFAYYNADGGGDHRFTPSIALQNNTWYHLTWTKTFGELGVKAYLNGISQTIVNDAATIGNNNSIILLGAWNGTGSTCTNGVSDTPPVANKSLIGSLDEVKIYDYIRTQKQILQDMNSNVPVGAATKVNKPIAWYKFDEGQGTIANNSGSIGSTSNGTFGTGNSAPTWTNDGKFNKALSLDGSDYVFLPGSNLENIGAVGDFTVTAWNNQSSFSGVEVIVGQGFAGAPGGHTYGRWQIGTSGSKGWISLYGGASSPSYKKLTGLINLSANTWNYIAAIYSRSESKLKLYINGKYDSQLNWDGYIENVFTNRMVIGYNSGTNAQYMTGLIDEVKIYNYALSADEIKQDYNQGSSAVIGKSNQTIGGTTTSLDYCIPGDTTTCSPPIAEYNFEENIGTTAYDSSGNGKHGVFATGSNTPSWARGKTGSGVKFDGDNDYISTNFNIGTTEFSVELFFKVNDFSDTEMNLLSLYNGSSSRFLYSINSNSGYKLRPFIGGALWGTTNLETNKWYHTVFTRNNSGLCKVYLDGKFESETTLTAELLPQIGMTIATGAGRFFNGTIDNVKVYNYARTPAQIAYDYNKGAPIGWWKMDECEGNIIHDASGLGNTGTITIGAGGSQVSLGTCSIGDTSAWSNGATGKINSAMSFDGTDDVITINDSPNLRFNSNDFSITAWIKHSSTINGILRGIYTKGGTAAGGFSLYIEFGNKLRFINQNSTTFDSNKIVADNTWHHIVASRKGNDLYYYIDGNLDNTSVNYFNGITLNDSSNVLIGLRDANRYFNGLIDDVRIYNYALTAEQVKQVYNGGAVSFN